MHVQVDKTGTLRGLQESIDAVQGAGCRSIILFACDQNGFQPSDIDPVLQNVSVPLIGGIFPAIIFGKDKLDKGTIALGCSRPVQTVRISDLENTVADIEAVLDAEFSEAIHFETLFVFVDAFSTHIGRTIEALFNVFGLEPNYIGCGAGSLSLRQKPCLFTNSGLVQNTTIIAAVPSVSGIGVTHGWQSFSGPFRVTKSEGNIIHTLDWRPAFNVYREAIETVSDKRFSGNDFYDISKAFPFGITKFGAERVVRDPIRVNVNQSLTCVGEVHEGDFVDILTGDEKTLLDAVARARRDSEGRFPQDKRERFVLFIDCISRVLFLGDHFYREIEAVYNPDFPLIGACTMGEIANTGNQYLEFYNKTSVVAQVESL